VGYDGGVCGYFGDLQNLLRDWLEIRGARIWCPALNPDQITALRQNQDDDHDDDAGTKHFAEASRPLSLAEVAAAAAANNRSAVEDERRGDAHAAVSEYAGAWNEWRLAASRGSSTASWKLAILYCRGLGVDRDTFEAARRCRSAAVRGHPRAQLRLARANERLLKYRDADLWQKPAREAGLIDRRLEVARARRLEGPKSQVLSITIDRLSVAARAGKRSDVVTLLALLATNGRSAEAKEWWTMLSADVGRLRIDDALVLEVSKAVDHIKGAVDI
jgi:TPR repeat protein